MKNYSIVAAVVAIALVLAFITATYNSKGEQPRSSASVTGPNILPPAMGNTANKQMVRVGTPIDATTSQKAEILPK